MASDTPRTVLITGTSSGIGLAAAVAAARAGWTVISTMRDLGRSEALMNAAEAAGVTGEVRLKQLDVIDPVSVTTCFEEIAAEFGGLHAVVNNAGAGHVGTIELETVEDVRDTMEVNFFGVVSVTKAAMPHLRASGGRLITVSSVGGVIGQPFNEAYCAAKFAVEGFMESLAPLAKSVGVDVVVVEPGAVGSEFVANVGIDIPSYLAAAGPYAPSLTNYLAHVSESFTTPQTIEDAATHIIDALNAERPAFRVQTSEWARDFVATKLADLDGSATTSKTTGWVSAG